VVLFDNMRSHQHHDRNSSRKDHDKRFLDLIDRSLKAGYAKKDLPPITERKPTRGD